MIGEPNGRPDSSPETQRLLFELMSRSANTDTMNGRALVFQFRFSDADPWHLVVDNGSTLVEPGEAPNPDLTVDTDWAQLVEITTRGENPLRALARRRLRPHGSVRGFRGFAKTFPPS